MKVVIPTWMMNGNLRAIEEHIGSSLVTFLPGPEPGSRMHIRCKLVTIDDCFDDCCVGHDESRAYGHARRLGRVEGIVAHPLSLHPEQVNILNGREVTSIAQLSFMLSWQEISDCHHATHLTTFGLDSLSGETRVVDRRQAQRFLPLVFQSVVWG